MSKGPILIDLDSEAASPADAPPVPELGAPTLPAVAEQLGRPGGRISRMGRWLGATLAALITAWIGIAMWDFVSGLLLSRPMLGWAFTGLLGVTALLLLTVAGREWLAYRRLGQLDGMQVQVKAAYDGSRDEALTATRRVMALYQRREDLRWKAQRVDDLLADQLDADAILGLVEAEMMEPLDKAALAEVESAARRVATVTALVPMALVDVLAALAANMRMVRAVAQIYGGRSGTLGSWRLIRAVLTHLVATGAVAIGDDLIGSVAGGALAGKISRRFGEGVINGALTARVGITAMVLCRPMPFVARQKPGTAGTVKRALTGVFRKG